MTREEAIRILKGDTLFNSREEQEAKEIAIKAFHENDVLKSRCAVLSQRKLCQFCKYSCEHRNDAYRGEEQEHD